MRKIFVLLFLASSLIVTRTSAQSMGSSYQTAIGIKFYPGALSIKHFTQEDRALEGLVNFWDGGFRFTGLYEIHGNISGAEGLKWYVGPGVHIGWYNGYAYNDYYYANGSFSFGIDGILGLDYKISGAPIDLSLDVQPYFELNHPYFAVWGGLAVRYTF